MKTNHIPAKTNSLAGRKGEAAIRGTAHGNAMHLIASLNAPTGHSWTFSTS